MLETRLSGADLERALNGGAFDKERSDTVTLEALVRKSKKKDHVSLGVGGCDSFVDVPTQQIASAEKIGFVMCGDHSHPRMRIVLTVSNDPTAQILSKLLATKSQISTHSSLLPDHRKTDDPDEDRYHRFRG